MDVQNQIIALVYDNSRDRLYLFFTNYSFVLELCIIFLIFVSASKVFGEWTNEGSCKGEGEDLTCGPGTQVQRRTCTDGTIDMCTDDENQRTVTCEVAGTALPVCSK